MAVIADLAADTLEERIGGLLVAIEVLAREASCCARLMSVPGIGPHRAFRRQALGGALSALHLTLASSLY